MMNRLLSDLLAPALHGSAALCVVLIASFATPAYAVHESLVIDNHPTGGPGATGEQIVVPSLGQPGSPLVEGPEAPGVPHVHGPWIGNSSPGHGDPHLLDSNFLLGHGIGEPIVHQTSPPVSGGGSPRPGPVSPGSNPTGSPAASRDVSLREVVIPLGQDGRAQGEGAELAALLGQAGWFDTLFVQPPPPTPVRTRIATKIGPEVTPPSPEEESRYQELIDLNVQFATRIAQSKAGLVEFNARIAATDTLIAEANKNGLPEVAVQFGIDKGKITERREEWRDYMMGQSAQAGRALSAAYQRNAADGVGPGNGDELVQGMAARGDFKRFRYVNGQLVEVKTLAADEEVVGRTRASTESQAAGAPQSTVHISIFADPSNAEAWRDFAFDYSDTFYDYLDDPSLFAERYWAYTKGAGLAVKDGLVDLAVLGVELIDTNLEIQQAALNALFGTDIDIFGSENIEFLYNTANAAAQLDSNAFFTTTDRFIGHFERRFEQMAGSGEKGIQEALQGTGYVFTTIIGGEEIAFKAVAVGAKGVKMIRLGRADEVLEAGEEIAQAGNAAADAGRAGGASPATVPPPGSSATPPGAGLADDAKTPVFGPDGKIVEAAPNPASAPPPARGPPQVRTGANGGALIDGPDGRILRQPGGEELKFGERLGGGGTSTAFAVDGNPNLIIKETRPGGNALAGALFDQAGQKMLNDIDPNLAVRQFGDPIIIDGKQYNVFERADSFQETRFRDAQAQGVDIPMKDKGDGTLVPDKARIELEMTPGQLAAYQEGIGKLNDRGFVFLDNKIDNWALVKVGEPDQYAMKIIDPGSIVKLTDADAARRMQQKIDAASNGAAVDRMVKQGNAQMGMQVIREELMEEFDQFIDKTAMNEYGVPIESVGEVPFNPVHGYQNPSVRALYDVDIAAMSDSEFADFLRKQGWDDAQIEEIMDLPPQLRADSVSKSSRAGDGSGSGAGGEMSDQEFDDHLRRQDPAYWTDERLRAYHGQPPAPNPWVDDMPPDIMGDDVPTQGVGDGSFRDAVTEIDAQNAAPPAAPPRLSFAPTRMMTGEAFAAAP